MLLMSCLMKNKKISVILFDCDGVLCDNWRFAKIRESEYSITKEMTKSFFKGPFLEALVGKAKIVDTLPAFLPTWNWDKGCQEFINLWLESEREVRQDVVQLVSKFKSEGYKVALATNQEANRANYMREVMNLEKIFDELFISCELGSMKPQQEYYEIVTKKLSCKPNEILFFDDEIKHVNSALEFGWNAKIWSAELLDLSEVEGLLG